MNEEWGTPISKDKIIYRRNKLIEYQKIGELRFTPLYEVIDENILDINYMIYEINRLNNIIEELEKYIIENEKINNGAMQCPLSSNSEIKEMKIENIIYDNIFDKLKELKGENNEKNI